mgnify:FL=1
MHSRDTASPGLLYGLYQRRLRAQINPAALPHHVAMIIDGNRRWAKLRDLESAAHGHRAGAEKYREMVRALLLSIGVITALYLLSTDNLTSRSKDELEALFEIIGDLADELSRFRNWRIKHVGAMTGLPESLQQELEAAEARTAGNTGMHVNLAIGYGGRREIVDAMHSIVRAHGLSGGTLDDLADVLTPELIGEHLYTGGQPDPDLVIRTSGEQRLSDFMLWQAAHSEFSFVEALGPDMREVDFLRAIRAYTLRDRRYGA